MPFFPQADASNLIATTFSSDERSSSSDIISYESACNASPTSIALASPNLTCDES